MSSHEYQRDVKAYPVEIKYYVTRGTRIRGRWRHMTLVHANTSVTFTESKYMHILNFNWYRYKNLNPHFYV